MVKEITTTLIAVLLVGCGPSATIPKFPTPPELLMRSPEQQVTLTQTIEARKQQREP